MTAQFTVHAYQIVKKKLTILGEEEFDDKEELDEAMKERYAQLLAAGVYLYLDIIERFYPYRRRRVHRAVARQP